MSVNFDSALPFMLVMLRMTGMLVFHPILGRSNVPVTANAALAFVLAVLVTPHVAAPALAAPMLPVFLYWVVKEMLVGLVAGLVVRMFISVLLVGGEMIDMQMGLGMAKAFDPGTNASISLTAQYLNILFILVFFLGNGHLTLIRITVQSFAILPLGSYVINFDSFTLLPALLGNVFLLAAKLSIPVVVVEIIVTFAVGIIMRVIPQINIFVVNIQFKLITGMLVLVLLVPSLTAFMENLLTICVENIETVWTQLAV